MPNFITSHDVLEPLKQAILTSRDVMISGQIFGSKLESVVTLGDGCSLPMLPTRRSQLLYDTLPKEEEKGVIGPSLCFKKLEKAVIK